MELKMQISSGRGPGECNIVVKKVLDIAVKEAKKSGIKVLGIESVEGDRKNSLKSAIVNLKGDSIEDFQKKWEGTVKWVGESSIRPGHKRKNWFIKVSFILKDKKLKWSDEEFRFETMRSKGPGGQHVNKTSSAVRVIHTPTGLKSISSDERSQFLNKKTAKARIIEQLENLENEKLKVSEKKNWNNHNELERGNSVRVFKGRL